MWCCQVAGLKDSFQLWKENISPPHPAGPRRKASGCPWAAGEATVSTAPHPAGPRRKVSGCPWAAGEATVSTGSLTCPRKVLACEPPWRLWSREGGTPGGPHVVSTGQVSSAAWALKLQAHSAPSTNRASEAAPLLRKQSLAHRLCT